MAFIARRLLVAIPTLFGITVVVFLLLRAVPGDPLSFHLSQLGPTSLTPGAVESLRAEYGLDRGAFAHYVHWLADVARFDLGRSTLDRRPVSEKIIEKLPATLLLNGVSLGTALLFSIPLGVRLARSPRGAEWANIGLVLLMSVPPFWAGLILADWLALRLNLLPLYGMGATPGQRLLHMVLPAICLTYGQLAFFTRLTSAAVREQILLPHAAAARARGAGEGLIAWRHGLRPAAQTVVSLFAIVLPAVLSGSVIIERLFAWDGIGRLYFDSVAARDYPTVMGLTLTTAVAVLLVNIATDVLYRVLDPRLALESSR